MKIHILGICGTFMGGIALLARELGFTVSGSDVNVYPPMSTQLERSGIKLIEGYDPSQIPSSLDTVVVGNALSRGNPSVEYVLERGLRYTSGPQWLAEHLLHERHVLAVAGTHGKTTTASMLAWILESAGLTPGFLIGGVPQNFGVSARLGEAPFFVVEADEYDTAFFDKRSKFVHYRPRTLVIANVEYDHADIFPDLAAIKRQFHHMVRTVPGTGLIVRSIPSPVIEEILAMGCWTPEQTFGPATGATWACVPVTPDFSHLEVRHNDQTAGRVRWSLIGQHNADNGLAAIAAARHAGVAPEAACAALTRFEGVKRRLEQLALVHGIAVYDDFAHHPTEISATLQALRRRVGDARIVAVFEPRSNTMRMGVHQDRLASAFSAADLSIFYHPPELKWDLAVHTESLGEKRRVLKDIGAIVEHVAGIARPRDHVLIMSNGGFAGIHDKLIKALSQGFFTSSDASAW